MQRRPDIERKTSISYKTEEKTVLRGYNLSDLAEEGYSFTDAMFVLFQNRIPTKKEEKMLRYEMGVFLEHSMSPSAAGAISVTAGRPNLTSAIAASISTFGGVHGPGAAHGYMMKKYLKKAETAKKGKKRFLAYEKVLSRANGFLLDEIRAEVTKAVDDYQREQAGGEGSEQWYEEQRVKADQDLNTGMK